MKIGDTIWQFHPERRHYKELTAADKAAGHRYSHTQLYRPKWEPATITGETSRSWITGDLKHNWTVCKIPKKGPRYGWAFSQKEVDDDCWIHDNRYFLGSFVQGVTDADVLRQIAAMVGYKDQPPT